MDSYCVPASANKPFTWVFKPAYGDDKTTTLDSSIDGKTEA